MIRKKRWLRCWRHLLPTTLTCHKQSQRKQPESLKTLQKVRHSRCSRLDSCSPQVAVPLSCTFDLTPLLPWPVVLFFGYKDLLHKGSWASSGLLDQPFSPDQCGNKGQKDVCFSQVHFQETLCLFFFFPCPPQCYVIILNIMCRPGSLPLSATSLSWRRSRTWALDLCSECDLSVIQSGWTVSNSFSFGEGGCLKIS